MSLRFRILGCGSSGGVPRITGDWGLCDPSNPKNHRTRCSLLVQSKTANGATNLLIDTSPDMRVQLLTAEIRHLDAILFSHDHADQTHGIDDLRALVYTNRKRIPVWMDAPTRKTLMARFGYCFAKPSGSDYPVILEENLIDTDLLPIAIDGAGGVISAVPFSVAHGRIDAIGYRIGDVAYTSDVSAIPDTSIAHLQGLECWIIDALRRDPHPTHFNLDEALAMVARFKPKRAILTNMHIDLDYDTLCAELPAHIRPAYDGMEFTVPF